MESTSGSEFAVEGCGELVLERDAGGIALDDVAAEGEGAEGHAVEGVGEGDDLLSAGGFAGELERGLDGIGAGRSGEHDSVGHPAWLEDDFVEAAEEVSLGGGGHVERVDDSARLQVADEGGDLRLGVVSVVESAGAAEEVEELAAVFVPESRALGSRPDRGPGAHVGAHFRLELGEDFETVHRRRVGDHWRPSHSASTMADRGVNVPIVSSLLCSVGAMFLEKRHCAGLGEIPAAGAGMTELGGQSAASAVAVG